MRSFVRTATCFALAALSAAALEKEFVDQMLESARNLERDASVVSLALKSKKADAEDVKKKIDAMSADLGRLHELVAKFESTNPQLSGRDRTDWQLIKDKVKLLEIFHDRKKQLASEDFSRNRTLIRAHADGVAKRAQRLQETARRLQRGS
ncbi:MAG: hypothetical protein U0Q16_30690 [Bryobacteraceae bacterium]